MNANELRIGNYLQSSCIIKIDAKFIYEYEKVGGNYKPIPLSEEILLKCGAKVLRDKERWVIEFGHNEGLYFDIHEKYVELCFQRGEYPFFKIDYLHQLQNLYFALTQTELTINL